MSKLRYGLFVLFAFMLINSCNSSSNNATPVVAAQEYPDFRKEENSSIPGGNGKSDFAPRNTASFHTIEIKQMKFQPNELKLHKGDTVLWINKDITDHDITEETNQAWTSSRLSTGKSWSKVVTESADYFCSLHLVMKGKLIIID